MLIPGQSGTKLSLCRCPHIGRQLPDNHTCGALCPEFPACLPAPSPELLARIEAAQVEGDELREAHEGAADYLSVLHEAIVAGLARKLLK